jgi:hypothetical protein
MHCGFVHDQDQWVGMVNGFVLDLGVVVSVGNFLDGSKLEVEVVGDV